MLNVAFALRGQTTFNLSIMFLSADRPQLFGDQLPAADHNATDDCGDWAILGLGSDARAWAPHIKHIRPFYCFLCLFFSFALFVC